MEIINSKIQGNLLQEFTAKYLEEHKELVEHIRETTKKQLLISGVVSSSVKKELLIAELDDKRCIGVEMNEDMWYLCRKETAQHLLDNYIITPK